MGTIIRRIRKTYAAFFAMQSASGILLGLSGAFALFLANSAFSEMYFGALSTKIFGLSIQHWINDGLMTLFFFVVGLELKKELVAGELRDFKKAALPIAAAIGGMVLPALIYSSLNLQGEGAPGWGIPMATDIAFALGVLTLFGNRVPLA
ncbi:MAG: sodium:proton antiporter, partial [Proteobacteria bacterium]